MERKKKLKTVKHVKSKDLEKPAEPLRKPDESEDKTTDYGGIPMRDLKKNLGCG